MAKCETGYIADILNLGASVYQIGEFTPAQNGNSTSELLNSAGQPFNKLGQLWVELKPQQAQWVCS